jgi:hypothetical protein
MNVQQPANRPPLHARRWTVLAAALLAAGLVPLAPPAQADVIVVECTGTWAWSFSPPLGLGFSHGSVHVEAIFSSNVCAAAATPCGGFFSCQVVGELAGGYFDATYDGGCIEASVHIPGFGDALVTGAGTTVAGLGNVNGVDWQLAGAFDEVCLLDPGIGEFEIAVELVT